MKKTGAAISQEVKGSPCTSQAQLKKNPVEATKISREQNICLMRRDQERQDLKAEMKRAREGNLDLLVCEDEKSGWNMTKICKAMKPVGKKIQNCYSPNCANFELQTGF